MRIRNTFIIFIVSGFWHGANWTFIVWGALNALFIMPSIIFRTNRNNLEIIGKGSFFPSFKDFIHMVITFFLTVMAWIFFRAKSVSHAIQYIEGIFTNHPFSKPTIMPYYLFAFISIFMLVEWIGRENNYAIEKFGAKWPRVIRWVFYYILIFCIFFYFGKEEQFIYFQF